MFEFAIMAVAIIFAAFYSGSETGFYCLNRVRLRVRAEGRATARWLQRMVARPHLAVSTMLVGTNLGLYVATIMCTVKLRRAGWAHADLYSSLIMPPVLLILAEIVPKSLFQRHADTLMYGAIWPLKVSQVVFYPLSALLRWVSALPQALVGSRTAPRRPTLTPDSFRFYLTEGAAEDVLSPAQRKMAQNILLLKLVSVSSAMTPIKDVVAISEDATYEELRDLLQSHRYSRIPLYRGAPDRIVGVINVMDVALAGEGATEPAELARGVLTLRPTDSVADALRTLRKARQQFAAVTDDEERAVGIVTIKDLVEEIVGELEAW